MIEFNNNTIVYMTAALESACRQLKNDTLQARSYIADRLEECAAAGRSSQRDLNNEAQEAVRELNRNSQGKPTIWERFSRTLYVYCARWRMIGGTRD